jgi:histone H3/H4
MDAEDRHVSKSLAEDVSSESFQQSLSPVIERLPESTRQMTEIEAAVPSRPPRRKKLKLTQKGNTVPALPSSLVKRVAIDSMTRTGKRRPVISREHLAALEQATEWFFEQVGEDLEAYSNHAKRRKRIDDTDVIILMKRQRVIGRGQSLDELAQEFLPDEILLNLTLPDEN